MKVQIINKSPFKLPEYKTILSSGMDLKADLTNPDRIIRKGGMGFNSVDSIEKTQITLYPNSRVIIPTGIYLEIPKGYEAQIRPRSGQSFKKGFILPNSPGTIDADYRGEVGVIIANYTGKSIQIKHGERIAQMVFAKVEQIEWDEVDTLKDTERGEGGFGHTGNN